MVTYHRHSSSGGSGRRSIPTRNPIRQGSNPRTFYFPSKLRSIQPPPPMERSTNVEPSSFLVSFLQWKETHLPSPTGDNGLHADIHTAVAVLLCLAAASMSSAGGIGGGALFLPILNLVAGVELKTATALSAFMVTGGSISNVLYNMCFRERKHVDFDVALLSEPCMLLGVSLGVICNVVFPEWLVTLLFVILLAFSTFKTCRTGLRCWKVESDSLTKISTDEEDDEKARILEEPLLREGDQPTPGFPWRKVAILLCIWLCFYALQSLRGGKNKKSIVGIEKCSLEYWLVSSAQIPLALLFTVHVLRFQKIAGDGFFSMYDDSTNVDGGVEVGLPIQMLSKILFPLLAFLAGVLGGLFGIGGGLLMNPVLLHIGMKPQVAAATSSFMVLFTSSMSSIQYLMIGMKQTGQAAVLATGCFLASLVGLIMVQTAVRKYGRASLIIFTVSTVMALSTIAMTCFGALDVWRDYVGGHYMGFKSPC